MTKKKMLLQVIVPIAVVGAGFIAYQVYVTNLAHSTFERYYAFRGCVELIDKTDTYGDCRLPDGKSIRLVLINDKWYLEGDGPGKW